MLKNKLSWALCALAAALMYLFENNAATFAVLLAALAVPAVFIALNLIVCKKISVKLTAPECGGKNRELMGSLVVYNDSRLSVSRMSCRVICKNLFTGAENEVEIKLGAGGKKSRGEAIAIPTHHCGGLQISVSEFKIYDALGITARRIEFDLYGDVRYVYANGLMNGTDNTHFSPDTNTSRGMIVTILWRLEGEPDAAGGSFADVSSSSYYAKAVAWAAANNIVTGYNTTAFGSGDDITREQFASILYRYAAYKGYDVTGQADLSGFSDSGSISGYAQTAVKWAVAEGIIKGDGSAISPSGKALRSAAAALLHRFCVEIVG